MATRKAAPAKKVAAKKVAAKKTSGRTRVRRNAPRVEFDEDPDIDNEVDRAAAALDEEGIPEVPDTYSTAGVLQESSRLEKRRAELEAAMLAIQTAEPIFPYAPGLSDEEKGVWRDLVNTRPVDYFELSDVPLMKMYCRRIADIQRMDAIISMQGEVIRNLNGNPIVNPHVVARSIAETRVLALSAKLRILPAARNTNTDVDKAHKERGKKARQTADTLNRQNDDINPMHMDEDGDLLATPTGRMQ